MFKIVPSLAIKGYHYFLTLLHFFSLLEPFQNVHLALAGPVIMYSFLGLNSKGTYHCPACNKECKSNIEDIPTNCHVLGRVLLHGASKDTSETTFDHQTNLVSFSLLS